MSRYICVHGHFYQPPRENPWTGTIGIQPSAHPFRDWNHRITSECYSPNGQCQVIGEHHEVLATINNYAYISFNFGPTLLSWMQDNAPQAYEKIIEADRLSMDFFKGHGSAIAQCYNHMIMPLANPEDQKTQVIWGIKDFRHRFHRDPEGMWLPETAVDLKTLDCLAEEDIQFTILAPKQAKRVRLIGTEEWEDVNEHSLLTQRTYLCRLPSGRSINLFFYNGRLSGEIAFGKIIRSAHEILASIEATWKDDSTNPIVSIAIDGETFGHHRRFGDMTLARLIYEALEDDQIEITNYAAYLAKHPPQYEVEIHENTAWSSSEGLERWKAAGGGCIHHHKKWTQAWRAPLREAMDYLRDETRPSYEEAMRKKGLDPWQARNNYIEQILQNKDGEPLLEMQKYLMYMYTSCGWFFDDISGLEVRQIMQYAARAIEYARKYLDLDLEEQFLQILERAESNIPKERNGRDVYERHIQVMKAA